MLLSRQKKVSPDFFDGNLAGQHASHYGGNWNSGARRTARVATPSGDGDDGITGGCNPQQHNPESLASNREIVYGRPFSLYPMRTKMRLKLLAAGYPRR